MENLKKWFFANWYKLLAYLTIIVCTLFLTFKALKIVENPLSIIPDSILKKFELVVDKQQEEIDKLNRIFKQYADGSARANVELINSTKELEKKVKKINSDVSEDFKKSKAEIKTYIDGQAKLNEKLSRNLKEVSDHVYKGKTENDKNKQLFKSINYGQVPVAWAINYPNRTENNWKTGFYPKLAYNLEIGRYQQKTGKFQTEAKLSVSNDGKTENLRITKLNVSEVLLTEKSWHFWNPTFNFGGYYGTSLTPLLGAGISFISYGKTEVESTYRFIGTSFLFNETKIIIGFEPMAYNFGQLLPIFKNLWLSPIIGYDFDNKIFGGIGISTNL